MMKTLAVCAALAPAAVFAQDASLDLFTESYAPYSYMEGDKLTGHAVDIVTEALSRSGVEASMELTKWTRAISLAEKKPNTCVFTTARTEEREDKFQWVGPMYTSSVFLVQQKGANADVTGLEQALTKTIGSQSGDYTVGLLEKMGATNIDLAADQVMTLKKLEAGRLDYAIVLQAAAEAATASGKLEIAMEAERSEFYLACSKTTDAGLVTKMNDAIGSIVADGSRDKFVAAYE
ncbi:polar amino acid transport system substrate-binding protein [Shimia isoporae]|uniref:Polar amino acid transport system substrate-binding protein n=1 Tax=Shimia isoporae TaxID=647720 RepID=A0A4R1N9C3_9RHOB|nr:transporter substrate-binding domain-containing protein [Shimia isoporae]TCL00382.1 polar amino acid transport system substrate-binding protein [Shimia isoporae]